MSLRLAVVSFSSRSCEFASSSIITRPLSRRLSSARSLSTSCSMTFGSSNRTPAGTGPREINAFAIAPKEPRLSSKSVTCGDPSPSRSTPRPDDLRLRGFKTMLGVIAPVLTFVWKSGFSGLGLVVEAESCLAFVLISALKSFFGDADLTDTFFEGGVFPGVVGRMGCGVSCFEGVLGFLSGVGCCDLGVTEARVPRFLLDWLRG